MYTWKFSPSCFDTFDIPLGIKNKLKNLKIENQISLKEVLNGENYYKNKDINEAENLLLNMLNFDSHKRFSAAQCLEHPFLLSK